MLHEYTGSDVTFPAGTGILGTTICKMHENDSNNMEEYVRV